VLGRHGLGKSTWLKLVNGDINPQSGAVSRQQNLRTAYLPQEVPADINGKVFDIVTGGLDVPHIHDEHHWQGQLQVEQVISRMQLDVEARFGLFPRG
jgi:ATP-binding cassette subfamily F protein uup